MSDPTLKELQEAGESRLSFGRGEGRAMSDRVVTVARRAALFHALGLGLVALESDEGADTITLTNVFGQRYLAAKMSVRTIKLMPYIYLFGIGPVEKALFAVGWRPIVTVDPQIQRALWDITHGRTR